jgi:hypothetical protein
MEILLVMGLVLGLLILTTILKKGEERAYAAYVKTLTEEEAGLLQNRICHLGTPMNISVISRYKKDLGPELIVSGNRTVLDLLCQLGGFSPGHFHQSNSGEVKLIGTSGVLSWERSIINTLPWLGPIAKAWKVLSDTKAAVEEDPHQLFHSPLWPKYALEVISLFFDSIDGKKIRDQELKKVLSGLSTRTRLPLAILLRPPGEFWQAHEALPLLDQIPDPLIKKILGIIGEREISENMGLFWSKILGMVPGGKKQKAVLDWLKDHENLLQDTPLRTEALFIRQGTVREALRLLELRPHHDDRLFLERCLNKPGLPRVCEAEIHQSIARLTSSLSAVSGFMSLSDSDQEGALSEEALKGED